MQYSDNLKSNDSGNKGYNSEQVMAIHDAYFLRLNIII